MKFYKLLLVAIFQLTVVLAFQVTRAKVSVNEQSIEFGEINTLEIKQLPLETTKDSIEFEIYLDEVSHQPHQGVIMLGNGKGLDFPVFPKFNLAKSAYKISLSAAKIPVNIRNLDKIIVRFIVSEEQGLIKHLGELIPSPELKDLVKYEPSPRLGIEPEIHHIFQKDPATVNPVIPLVFIGGAIALFLGLISLWTGSIGSKLIGNLHNIQTLQLLNNVSFLMILLGYEVIFIRYYLGQSIFQTLFHSFILAGPAIYLGSRTFRFLAKLRAIGRA